jgi:actin-related protein
MEDKALKCITVAQRMLPGALEETIEDQATDLMFLPERALLATLQRQSDLATKIAAEMCDDDKKKDEDKEAKKKDSKEEEEVEDKKKKEDEEVEAKKKDSKKEDEEVEAKKKDSKKEDEEVEAKKKAADLLDVLFDSPELPTEPKLGAKSLQGLIKNASSVDDPLSGLWETPPDVSSIFSK